MNSFQDLIIGSFSRPRDVAKWILSVGLPHGVILEGALLVTVLGVILSFAAIVLSGGASDPLSAAIMGAPLLGAGVQFVFTLVIAGVTSFVGRSFGGKGDFWGALTMVVWLNIVMAVIQVAQVIALAFAPPFAVLLQMGALFWALWAFSNFVAELHDFENQYFVMGGVVLSAVALFFFMAMLLTMLGVSVQGMG